MPLFCPEFDESLHMLSDKHKKWTESTVKKGNVKIKIKRKVNCHGDSEQTWICRLEKDWKMYTKKQSKVNCENSLTEKWIDVNWQTGIKGNDQTVKWMDLKINKGENSENR